MRSRLSLSFATVACLLPALPAAAASSTWFQAEGGKVRLLTTGAPDAAGRLQGALEIVLKPGWKTYWRDPGDSGVPPQLDIAASTNIAGAEMAFPAPRRHDDGYGQWAGYDRSVAFPVTFTLATPGQKAQIDADLFLGMCETICIPVQTRLSVNPASGADDPADADAVEAALSALPSKAGTDFGVTALPGHHETLVVEAHVPGDPEAADFFVAGPGAYMFGTPRRSEDDGKVVFSVPILDRPSNRPSGAGLHYTLTGATGAVSGLLPYP